MAKKLVLESKGFTYGVRWMGGGEVPKALSGQYTSMAEADKAIGLYLSTRRTRKTKDGQTGS